MTSHDISNHPFLPDDNELSLWQKCIKQSIIEVHGRWCKYGWTAGHGGVSQELSFRGRRLLRAADPPLSYCCGATYEVFIEAWKKYVVMQSEKEGREVEDASWSLMNEIRKYFFLIKDEDHTYSFGAKDGIWELYEQIPWLEITDFEDPREATFGSFCQIQFRRDPFERGHSVVVLGSGKWKGQDVLHVWSSNNYYDQSWPHSKNQVPGYGFDYYYIDRVVDGFQRTFHIGTIVD